MRGRRSRRRLSEWPDYEPCARNPFEVRAFLLLVPFYVVLFFSRFPCLQSNWKSWLGEGQIAIPLLLIFLFAYAFPVLGSEWKTTEQFSANSNSSSFFPSLFILFYYVCANVCVGGCVGVSAFQLLFVSRIPISHFAFSVTVSMASSRLSWVEMLLGTFLIQDT